MLASDFAQAEILSSSWASLSQRIGEDIESSTLFQRLNSFETALRDAALSPESTTHANQVVQSAKDLVTEFNALGDLITERRFQADQDIADSVAIVNASLQEISDLNRSLASIDRTSAQAASLFDERGRVLDRIAEHIPIQTFERDSGAIDVLTTEGVYLVAGPARTIEFTPTNTMSADFTLAGGDLSGLTVDGVDITPGAPTFGAVSSGSLAALFTLRDTDLTTLQNQLDTMAQDMIDRFTDPAIDPTLLVGDPGLFLDSNAAAGAGVSRVVFKSMRWSIRFKAEPSWRLRDGLGAVAQRESWRHDHPDRFGRRARTGSHRHSTRSARQLLSKRPDRAARFARRTTTASRTKPFDLRSPYNMMP